MRRAVCLTVASLTCLALSAPTATAAPARAGFEPDVPGLSGWAYSSTSTVDTLSGGQGLTSVPQPDGSVRFWHQGPTKIPVAVRAEGWGHVGDPGSYEDGTTVDPYEAGTGATSKMYRFRRPDGSATEYVHPLDDGEMMNNSWVEPTPDQQWFLSGEWETMSRLLVFPTPGVNPAQPADDTDLPSAAPVTLDHEVRDVQGCTFVSDTRLVCSSDADDTDLWPHTKPLLQITLPRPVDGQPMTAHVESLGSLPTSSWCGGDSSAYEVEGLDYSVQEGALRVQVIPPAPCIVRTRTYLYVPSV